MSWPGWTPARPRQPGRATSASRRFTSAARRSSAAKYIAGAAPLKPGENRKQIRAAFALTEPIPFVGVETGMLAGKVRVAEWKDGSEPLLQVDKRGRFITNMGFANVVTAAVDSDDQRIKGSCMVILEEADPGILGPRHADQKTRPPAFLDATTRCSI